MKDETGPTFHHWRLQVRVDEAVCRLAKGASVGEVAHHLGYRSASAFVYMFRSLTGIAPAQYLDKVMADEPQSLAGPRWGRRRRRCAGR